MNTEHTKTGRNGTYTIHSRVVTNERTFKKERMFASDDVKFSINQMMAEITDELKNVEKVERIIFDINFNTND